MRSGVRERMGMNLVFDCVVPLGLDETGERDDVIGMMTTPTHE
jgi:hypothetical protein